MLLGDKDHVVRSYTKVMVIDYDTLEEREFLCLSIFCLI